MFERYPNLNPPIRQHSTTELQTEIRSLKAQVKELKDRVFFIETKNLELDTQIALLQSRTSKRKEILFDSSISEFPLAEIPMPGTNPQDSKFISIIEKITFQKWNIYWRRSKLHQRWVDSYQILRPHNRIIGHCKRYAPTG
ncbi:hypothetical protein M9H77_35005 [Catharanthus roseus]|uniref:Uncharacterized protein n=1 Tax=Catharanthus roseus TaxID=4058 RepID=A0ACB9ZRF3_CATRO|nr:hypothetical protein M9H77_35005 [Catharanthus roseus]